MQIDDVFVWKIIINMLEKQKTSDCREIAEPLNNHSSGQLRENHRTIIIIIMTLP